MRSARAAGLVAALVAIAGCANSAGPEEDQPPPRPSSGEVARFVAATRHPAYWLGPRYRGLGIGLMARRRDTVSIGYGDWTCSAGSGCTAPDGVRTQARELTLSRDDFSGSRIDRRDCWVRIGRAVAALLGCEPDGYPQELEIYTGPLTVEVTSLLDGSHELSAETVARALRPLNGHAPWPLERPQRLTCSELGRVARQYHRHMPRAIRPARAC